jgi:hypothetical protein
MTRDEAYELYLLLDFDLAFLFPERGAADVIWDAIERAGFKLALEHATADWVVYDENDRELARVG